MCVNLYTVEKHCAQALINALKKTRLCSKVDCQSSVAGWLLTCGSLAELLSKDITSRQFEVYPICILHL